MADVTFKIEVDIPIKEMLDEVLDDATRLEINEALAKWCDPYVPYHTGALSQNIEISVDGVTYNQPYAAKNYYGVGIAHRIDVHPLATAKWDEAMMQDHSEEFLNEVNSIISRRLQELNG